MKFTIQLVAIVVTAFLLELFLPWWSLAIAAFACGYFLKSSQNFLAGFLAIALLWATTAFIIDQNAAAPLSERMARLFSINKPLLFLASSVIGGLVGGFATLSGSLLKKDKRKSLYY